LTIQQPGIVQRLEAAGVRTKIEKSSEPANETLAGKLFVLTGTLAAFTRDEARAALESRGGRVTSAVSKKTDYVWWEQKPDPNSIRHGTRRHVIDEPRLRRF